MDDPQPKRNASCYNTGKKSVRSSKDGFELNCQTSRRNAGPSGARDVSPAAGIVVSFGSLTQKQVFLKICALSVLGHIGSMEALTRLCLERNTTSAKDHPGAFDAIPNELLRSGRKFSLGMYYV